MSDFMDTALRCICGDAWQGTVPPLCPLHMPVPTACAPPFHGGYAQTFTLSSGPKLCDPLRDEDVERIARRVVELLKAL